MISYDGLSKEQLIERLSFAETQLTKLAFSMRFKENVKAQPYKDIIPMAFVGAEGNLIYINSALCEMSGFSEDEVVGRPLSDFVLDDDRFWDRELLRRMVAGESELFRGEHRLVTADGGSIWLDVIAVAIRDEKGKFCKATYLFNNISVSKSNEKELADLLDTQKRISDALMLIMQNETGVYEDGVLQIILERYDADRAYLFQFDWKNGFNRNISEVVADGISREIDRLQYLPNSMITEPIARFREGKPFIINNLEESNPENNSWDKETLSTQNIKSIILFPIIVSNELWGYLGIDMVRDRKTWSDSEIEWLSSFTSVLSVLMARKFAIDKLDKQQELFDLILDSGSLGYWKINVDAGRMECSDNYLSLIGGQGFSTKDISLNSLWKIIHNEDLPNLMGFLNTISTITPNEHNLELRILNENNKWKWNLLKAVKAEYDNYTKSYVVTLIIINIHQTKNAALEIIEKDAQLKQNEHKLRTIFDNIPVGIALFDNNGDYVNCNTQMLTTFSGNTSVDIGRNNVIIRARSLFPNWDGVSVLNFGFTYDNKTREIATRDSDEGDIIHVLFKIIPLMSDEAESIKGFLVISIDESEHKLLETSLRKAKETQEVTNSILSSVIELSQVLPWDCNVPTETFSCDYQTYHHESQSEPIGGRYYCTISKYIESIHPDFREHMREVFTDLATGKRDNFHEIYMVHWYNDREYEWIDKQGEIYEYDENGFPKTLIGSTVVITERKQMEHNLLNAIEQAEQSNRLKSAFLANMSHEIRTPLNAIVGFSEMIADVEDPVERREYADIISTNNHLLLQLISDILDISKIEAGTLEFVYSDVDINSMLQDVQATSQLKVDSSVVKISIKDSMPRCVIFSERNRLLQVVNNLMTNAIKFTAKGEINIGYRLQDDNVLYFYVQDSGCGISDLDLHNVFGRFVKLNNFVPGTGLGLSICDTIISRLGGKIGVESKEGVGSTFWFTIPYDESSEDSLEESNKYALKKKRICPKSKPRILIAEDNESNYKLFETILKKDFTLIHAWDGIEAVEMFNNQHPDIILMDIKMPELGGLDATQIIRETSKDIPIIAITAFAFDSDREKAFEVGSNDFVTKPINAKELLAMIDKYLK